MKKRRHRRPQWRLLPLILVAMGGARTTGGATAAAADDDDAAWGTRAASPSASDPATPAAFTARTRDTLARVRAADGGPSGAPASLRALAAGASRLDAARAFFEVLVLRSRGCVTVEQAAPYGDIELRVVGGGGVRELREG